MIGIQYAHHKLQYLITPILAVEIVEIFIKLALVHGTVVGLEDEDYLDHREKPVIRDLMATKAVLM